MPWVRPVPANEVGSVAAKLIGDAANITIHGQDVQAALVQALSSSSNGNWTVAAGSLYLIGDIHRLLRRKQLQIQDDLAARLNAKVRPD